MLTRQGIVEVLTTAGVDVVGQAANAEDLLDLVRVEHPDAAVVDIRMPPTSTDEGIVAAQRIRADHPTVAVLILSHHLDAVYALRLFDENPGSVGYLIKDRVFDATVLVTALGEICAGETVIDSSIVAQLLARRRRIDPLESLTEREREVLALVAEGLSNKAIAGRTRISERTVEAHITRIFDKLSLVESPDQHRRVLAVLTLLSS